MFLYLLHFGTGASKKIIDKVENKKLILVLSEPILEEYFRVLNYTDIQQKIKNRNLEMRQSVLRIVYIAEIVDVKTKITAVVEDPDDNKIIECAVDGQVNYLITKDNHLLKLKEYYGIKIMSPEEFLNVCG